jgi:hypothetical protein
MKKKKKNRYVLRLTIPDDTHHPHNHPFTITHNIDKNIKHIQVNRKSPTLYVVNFVANNKNYVYEHENMDNISMFVAEKLKLTALQIHRTPQGKNEYEAQTDTSINIVSGRTGSIYENNVEYC